MFCGKCGKEIRGNALFCTYCGEKGAGVGQVTVDIRQPGEELSGYQTVTITKKL